MLGDDIQGMRPSTLIPVVAVCVLAAGCSVADPEAPTPDQARYVQQVGSTIDSRLGDGIAAPLELAKKICTQLAQGRSDADVAADAQRFTDGEGYISHEQAVRLVATTKDTLCKKSG